MTPDESSISEDITKEQLKNAGIDIDTIEDLSKSDLIKLLSDAVDDSADTNSSNKDGENKNREQESQLEKNKHEYNPPEGWNLTTEESALIRCESTDPRKETARAEFLGLDENINPNILLIQYHPISEDALENIVEQANKTKIIAINYNQEIPESVEYSITVNEIEDPSDVTQLGILTTGVIDDWVDSEQKISVSIDSVDKQLQHKTTEGLFRFLHIFINKLTTRKTKSHFFVDPSNTDEPKINTIESLFDATITIDDNGVSFKTI